MSTRRAVLSEIRLNTADSELASDVITRTVRPVWWPTILIFPMMSMTILKSAGFTSILGVDPLIPAFTLVVVAAAICLHGSRSNFKPLTGLFVFLVCLVPSLSHPGVSEYGEAKPWTFLLISVPLAISAFIVASDPGRLSAMLRLVVVNAAMAAVISLAAKDDSAPDSRLDLGGNTLGLGYALGAGIVVVAIFVAQREWRIIWALPGVLCLLFVLLSVGSRGPIVGVLLGLLLATVSAWAFGANAVTKWRLLLTMGVLTAGGLLLLNFSPASSQDRVESLTQAGALSTEIRPFLWEQATEIFHANPIVGIGFGGYADHMSSLDEIRYPHNLLLEIAAEGGMIGILGFTIFFVSVITVGAIRMRDAAALPTLGLFLFWMLGAGLFSSDLLAREWLVWGCATLALQANRTAKADV